MSDTIAASINARLHSDPRFVQLWNALQARLGSIDNASGPSGGERGSTDNSATSDPAEQERIAARQAFGYATRQLVKEYGIEASEDYMMDPTSGNVIYQPDHSTRNNLLLLGAVVLGGAAAQYGADKYAAVASAAPTSQGTLASLGGGGAAATDVGAGATVAGGIEGGAYGLSDTALAGLGTGAMGSTAVPAGVGASTVASTAAAPTADYATNAAGVVTQAASVPAETGGIGATIGKIANSSWFPAVASVAGNLGGALIQSNASEKAAELQAQSAKDALDFAKSQAALEQKNFAPYLAAGTGALSKLSYGLGIGDAADYNSNGGPATPPGGSLGSLTPAGDPVVGPHSPAANFINSTRTQPVWMTAPTGERKQVPANQVQHYLDLKATIDPGQGLDGGSVPRPGSLAMIGRTPVPSATVGTATARV